MLIDDFMPDYEFHERHVTLVPAPKDLVRRAAGEWRPASSFLWRWLLRLRGLGTPTGTLRGWAEGMGFLLLAETSDEVLFGQAGRFWSLNERASLVSPRTVEEFRAIADPRYAVAVMNIAAGEGPEGRGTRLSTETRIRCLGPGARRWFRLYWLLIRPFSGLLRRSTLNGIKHDALKLASENRTEVGRT